MVDFDGSDEERATSDGRQDGTVESVDSVGKSEVTPAQPLVAKTSFDAQCKDASISADEAEELDDLSSMRAVKNFIEDLDEEKAERERRQVKAVALIKTAAPWAIKGMVEMDLPPAFPGDLWKVLNKMKMTPRQKAACYFVSQHLLKAKNVESDKDSVK